MTAPQTDAPTLQDHLRAGQQCDQDGVMCIVSRQACHEAEDALDERDATIAALVRALEPFANYMHTEKSPMDQDHLGNPLPDDQGVGWIYLTHGDFRTARAALAKAQTQKAAPHSRDAG